MNKYMYTLKVKVDKSNACKRRCWTLFNVVFFQNSSFICTCRGWVI